MGVSFIVLEDDILIAEFISSVLLSQGHSVKLTSTKEMFFEEVQNATYNLALLDVDIDGSPDGIQVASSQFVVFNSAGKVAVPE